MFLKWDPGLTNHGGMKNNFTTGLYILAMVLIISGTTRAQNDESDLAQKKPNVIILFSDQHNKKVMGFEGHPDVITPNLDKFASEGLIFDRAYCTVGICTPSRSSLLTGLMPRTLGLLNLAGDPEGLQNTIQKYLPLIWGHVFQNFLRNIPSYSGRMFKLLGFI